MSVAVAQRQWERRLTRPEASTWLLVGALALLAAALRWACIHQSLFGDELFLYARVHARSFTKMLSLIHDNENTPPLFFIVAWIFAKAGDPMLMVRLPSLIANVALIGFVFDLTRRSFGRTAGLLAVTWFALSPFQIFYGTEDRAYSAAALLVVISTMALLAALHDPRRRRWWLIYVIASVAAIYTHYIAVLVLGPQALWGLWRHRETMRRQLAWHGAVLAAVIPWIPFFVLQARHSARESVRLSVLSPLTPSTALKTEVQSLIGHPFIAPGKLPGVVPTAVLGLVLLAACTALVFEARRRGAWRPQLRDLARSERGLMALLALSPIVLIVIYSLRPHTSLLLPRNLEVGVPYACGMIGWVLTRWATRWSVLLTVIALTALAVGTVKMMSGSYQRPDGRAAARFLDATAAPNAAVIDFPGPQGTQFYFRRVHRLYTARFDWTSAARAHQQVVLTFLTNAACPPTAPAYRLSAGRSWPSTPARLAVCEYLPAPR